MDILFEDNHLLVVNKPAGLLTQPSGTDQDSLEGHLKALIKVRDQKPGRVFLEAIHRLDKPVSGIVVFSKTSKALSRLQASMREKQTQKIYCAWVEGQIPQDQGVLEDYLIHDDFRAQVVPKTHLQAKYARLSYRVLERRKDRTLLEIELDTGRYHQIRVQLSHWGHPIMGDQKYGSQYNFNSAIALHHRRLCLVHPISKDNRVFDAPPPPLFEDLG